MAVTRGIKLAATFIARQESLGSDLSRMDMLNIVGRIIAVNSNSRDARDVSALVKQKKMDREHRTSQKQKELLGREVVVLAKASDIRRSSLMTVADREGKPVPFP